MERKATMANPRTFMSFIRAIATPERLLRWSLGIVYLWFGTLKLVGMSPVLELVQHTYPPLATVPLYCGLTLFEVALGIVLLFGFWKRWAAAAAVFHLIGTFGVLVMSPRIAFLPQFPFLTMEGEFVVKNFVLLAAASALLLGVRQEAALINIVHQRPRLWILMLFLVLAVGLGFTGAWLHQSLRADTEPSITPVSTQIHMTAGTISAFTNVVQAIVVQGVVIDHCRLLGCWLKLHDQTGDLFVDLASAGLSAKRFPIGSRVQVTGHISKTREGKVGFVASNIKLLVSKEIP